MAIWAFDRKHCHLEFVQSDFTLYIAKRTFYYVFILPKSCVFLFSDLRVIDNKQQLNGFSLQVHANDTTNLSSRDQYLGLLNQSSHFVQQSYDVVSGFRNEHSPHVHNGSFHNQPPSLDPNTVSSSADEYEDSVIIAQGYDSMCCEAMLSESSTYHF